jgi:putative protease
MDITMRLLAPVTTYESTKLQIEAGATEIYVGANTDVFDNFNFSGRGKYNTDQVRTFAEDDELCSIINLAHQNDVLVMYAANFPFIANDPDGGRSYANAFLKYVQKGVDMGVDSIILGDIGSILLCRKEGIKTHISSSSFLETLNTDQVYMLKELGVNRAVLSYQMKLEEIEEIARQKIMEIEVFGHFGCSFYDGYCNLKHFYGETKECQIGTPCQANYQIYDKDDNRILDGQCFNYALICSMCSLYQMKQAGVDSVKLVGRSRDASENAKITRMYAEAIRVLEDNEDKSEMEVHSLIQSKLPIWWKRVYCRHHLCKYKCNDIIARFV